MYKIRDDVPMQAFKRRPRDSQRKRVYECDWVLYEETERFANVNEIQWFIDDTLAKLNYIGLLPGVSRRVTVIEGRGKRAFGGMNSIRMPRWSWHKLIAAHELAHTLAMRLYGYENIEPHGPEYCGVYLVVTKHAISVDMWARLMIEFARHDVDYHVIEGLKA